MKLKRSVYKGQYKDSSIYTGLKKSNKAIFNYITYKNI